jgi:NAD(P)H-dependent FMN reductase
MKTQNILALVGGISKNSINRKLFEALKGIAPEAMKFSNFDISKLPFYSQDLEMDLPGVVQDLKSQIVAADAILFVTPEYNRSVPGVLKNAIDWASRPYGKSVWKSKKAAILGMSPGKTGTMASQQHLRLILSAVGVYVLPQPEIYLVHSETLNEKGELASERTKEYLQNFLKTFSECV